MTQFVNAPSLPPGPRLPAAAQAALLLARPFQFLEACRDRYGDIFQLRASGVGSIVCVYDPGAIREVFALDGAAAHAGAANMIVSPVIGTRSLLTIDRDAHLERRRALSPAFHGEALKSVQAGIEEIIAEEEARWPAERTFPLRPALQRVTFRIIALIALGQTDPERVDRLLNLFERLVAISPAAAFPAFRVDLGPLSPWGRFRRIRRQLDEELLAIVSERREGPPGPDLLSLIAQGHGDDHPDDEQARDELMALLLAGHETTASALAWAFERLSRNPEALAQAREAAAKDDFEHLDAVACETLRSRPVLPNAGRVLDQPLRLGDYVLPAGTTLQLSIALVQSDPRHYPEPGAFCPQRFVAAPPDPLIWLPFGGGRRRCMGAALAKAEMRTILWHVLRRRSVLAPSAKVERPVLRGVTLAPNRDAFLHLPLAESGG